MTDQRQNYSLKPDFQHRVSPPKTITQFPRVFQSEIRLQSLPSINLGSVEQQRRLQSAWRFPEMQICMVRYTNFAPQKFNCDSLINDNICSYKT